MQSSGCAETIIQKIKSNFKIRMTKKMIANMKWEVRQIWVWATEGRTKHWGDKTPHLETCWALFRCTLQPWAETHHKCKKPFFPHHCQSAAELWPPWGHSGHHCTRLLLSPVVRWPLHCKSLHIFCHRLKTLLFKRRYFRLKLLHHSLPAEWHISVNMHCYIYVSFQCS